MDRIRIEQRKNETPDITVMRAFAMALEKLPRRHAIAAARWMEAKARDYTSTTQDSDFIKL